MDLDLLGKRVLGRVPTGSLIGCLDTLILFLLLPDFPCSVPQFPCMGHVGVGGKSARDKMMSATTSRHRGHSHSRALQSYWPLPSTRPTCCSG